MRKNLQEQLNKDLKVGCNADCEMENVQLYKFMEDVMQRVELKRGELFDKCGGIYSQGYLAKKAGISRVTYNNYLNNGNIAIKLITLKRMADILRCDIIEFLE